MDLTGGTVEQAETLAAVVEVDSLKAVQMVLALALMGAMVGKVVDLILEMMDLFVDIVEQMSTTLSIL